MRYVLAALAVLLCALVLLGAEVAIVKMLAVAIIAAALAAVAS